MKKFRKSLLLTGLAIVEFGTISCNDDKKDNNSNNTESASEHFVTFKQIERFISSRTRHLVNSSTPGGFVRFLHSMPYKFDFKNSTVICVDGVLQVNNVSVKSYKLTKIDENRYTLNI